MRIVGEDGADAAPETIGEIRVRSRSALSVYLDGGRPVDPRRDGWIPTGDLGRVDDEGFLYLVGRVREVLVCGGFNVYPAMVEAALHRQPGVVDSVVVGLPDERLGEVPAAATLRS